VAYLGALFGGAAGFVLGCPTGLLAGLVLAVTLKAMMPVAAAWTTVAVVLFAQVGAGIAIFGAPTQNTWLAYAVVPAITVVPLALATRKAARDNSGSTMAHRDTLAT
jgi:hypothetical protein